jgi:hypothetical protein
MEGDLYRSQPLVGRESSEAGLQGRFDIGGCAKLVFEGYEQDDGFYKAGKREV